MSMKKYKWLIIFQSSVTGKSVVAFEDRKGSSQSQYFILDINQKKIIKFYNLPTLIEMDKERKYIGIGKGNVLIMCPGN